MAIDITAFVRTDPAVMTELLFEETQCMNSMAECAAQAAADGTQAGAMKIAISVL